VITGRDLLREEIPQVWKIDRREVVENVYHLEHGALVMRPRHIDVQGWPPGEAEMYTPILTECFDRGGWFHGLFEDGAIVGVAIVDSKRIGKRCDRLQLQFLHVSNAYRKRGLGARLFEMAKSVVRARGARRMYVSATPSENTIKFYMRMGCEIAEEPDPELLAREPEDIHLECEV
jgi:predicted N-acetyltransferase YhbS